MSDEPDRDDGDDDGESEVERTPSGRKRRKDAGRPRGPSGGSRKHVSTRFERRTKAVAETIRELVRIGRPKLDIGELSFVEVVDRDADAWGRFFAQVAEWFVPFGAAIDAFFGSSLITILNMTPSFRAARRDLHKARERRAAERAEAEDEELREAIAADHAAALAAEPEAGVFAQQPPPASRLGVVEQDPREAWARRGE